VDTTSKHAKYEDNVRDAEELDALIYPVEYDTSTDMSIWGPGSGGGRQSSGNVVIDVIGAIFGGGSGNSGGNSGGGYPGGRGGGRGGRGGRGGGGGGWPGGGGSGNSRDEYERGDRYLHDLARVTGGRLYNAEQQNLDAAFRSVAEELRRQYSLGYYPKKAPQSGERRSIKVRVDRPELAVRARDSYVFQPGANNSAQGQTNSQPKPPVLKKELSGGRF
jgi:VWFA-related protein